MHFLQSRLFFGKKDQIIFTGNKQTIAFAWIVFGAILAASGGSLSYFKGAYKIVKGNLLSVTTRLDQTNSHLADVRTNLSRAQIAITSKNEEILFYANEVTKLKSRSHALVSVEDSLEEALPSIKFLDDKRIQHFYDPNQITGKEIAISINWDGKIAWDIYLFYPQNIEWSDMPPKPIYWMRQISDDWAKKRNYRTGDNLKRELAVTLKMLLDK